MAKLFEEYAPVGVTGTFDEAVERLLAYRAAGVDRIMLQHLLHDDLDAIPLLARLGAEVGSPPRPTAAKRCAIAAACSFHSGT